MNFFCRGVDLDPSYYTIFIEYSPQNVDKEALAQEVSKQIRNAVLVDTWAEVHTVVFFENNTFTGTISFVVQSIDKVQVTLAAESDENVTKCQYQKWSGRYCDRVLGNHSSCWSHRQYVQFKRMDSNTSKQPWNALSLSSKLVHHLHVQGQSFPLSKGLPILSLRYLQTTRPFS